jgi:hypothetical protein
MMAKRTNRVAWRLAAVLAVVLWGGIGVGVHHAYSFYLTTLPENEVSQPESIFRLPR